MKETFIVLEIKKLQKIRLLVGLIKSIKIIRYKNTGILMIDT
jgi:hypothetical protein